MAQIAKEFLCSKAAIRSALTNSKIPVRRRSHPGHSSFISYGRKIARGRRVDCAVEQRIIDTIKDLRRDGMSFDKIAQILTKMGIPTKTRRKKWKGPTVRLILLSN